MLTWCPASSPLPSLSSFPVSSPPSCGLSSWHPHLSVNLPGHRVRMFGIMGLVLFLRNGLNVSVSNIECKEKKKKLTAQMMIHIIWATLCTKWLICGQRWCWCCCVLLWESVLMALRSWEERGERGIIIVDGGGGVGKSDELAVIQLCDLSYAAMPMPLGG